MTGRGIRLDPEDRLSSLGIDFGSLQQASFDTIPIAAGEITTLDDARFPEEQASAGMWSPLTTVRGAGGGIYFLEPYDPDRIPVVLVHGIGGSPQDFRVLIESLDRTRFQPWVYHYPSGVRLHRAGRFLAQLVASLERQLGVERLFVTAHGMGGLVARSSLLQMKEAGGLGPIELLVTFSTPWNGHAGATKGVKYSPAVVPAWIDMQPDSDFLRALRTELPGHIPHHLFFGFQTRGNLFMRYSHDTVVSVESQLHGWFQQRSARTYGYDLDHVDILSDPEVVGVYNEILEQAASRQYELSGAGAS